MVIDDIGACGLYAMVIRKVPLENFTTVLAVAYLGGWTWSDVHPLPGDD